MFDLLVDWLVGLYSAGVVSAGEANWLEKSYATPN
jgi:hypothetical protein